MSRTPASVLAELQQLTAEFARVCQLLRVLRWIRLLSIDRWSIVQRKWHRLGMLGKEVCDRSQVLHLLMPRVRRRADVPCNTAEKCLRAFVDDADRVLAQWQGTAKDKEDLKLYRDNVAKRAKLLKELGERKADLDKDLGYLAKELEACSLA